MNRVLTLIVILLLALPAAVGASSVSFTTRSGTSPIVTLSPTQARAYSARVGFHLASGDVCSYAQAWQELQVRWVNKPVATIVNRTYFCWTAQGGTVPGSINVVPSFHTAAGFADGNRVLTIGYPYGKKAVQRNTCVLGQVSIVYQGFPMHWNMSGRILLNSAKQLIYRGSSVNCYANIASRSY